MKQSRVAADDRSGFAAAALVSRRDVQVFAVFGDSAPGDLNSLPLQHGGQLVVREGMARVLLLDELAHLALEDDQRSICALRAVGALGEEEAQLDYALRRMGVLVGDGAAHGGWMH